MLDGNIKIHAKIFDYLLYENGGKYENKNDNVRSLQLVNS